jgi:hypothetical protein
MILKGRKVKGGKTMDANERIEKRHVVVDTPGVRREVVTETSRGKSEESSISGATIALIALLAVVAIGIVVIS